MKTSYVLLKADLGDDIVMHRYSPEVKRGDGAVIIFSGGGYSHRAYHEGEPYALKLNEMGIEAFVVDYSVAPYGHPVQLGQARRAVSFVRHKAKEWNIDGDKIAVMGSSAGGHLAALCATSKEKFTLDESDEIDKTDHRPNAQILCYPVTDKKSHAGSYKNLIGKRKLGEYRPKSVDPILLADKDTPPAFIWHTSTDDLVDIKGTYRYATRLSELGVLCELHVYPIGVHGLGLATGDSKREPVEYVQRWIEDLERWLKLMGWINK
ncbi:MAG: alpha/beta hydrolase [Clostridia bacterium]|nr:alpha/beta hydrolase [Clostridia bacterium]